MDFKGLKSKYPDVPVLALSGSMSPKMIQGYVNFLEIDTCQLIEKHPDRSNIYYKVVPISPGKVADAIVEYIKGTGLEEDCHNDSCGIIYCRTPKHCEDLQARLEEEGITALVYHGKLSEEMKSSAFQLWKNNRCNIMVATVSLFLRSSCTV